jgi:hypothetical protein
LQDFSRTHGRKEGRKEGQTRKQAYKNVVIIKIEASEFRFIFISIHSMLADDDGLAKCENYYTETGKYLFWKSENVERQRERRFFKSERESERRRRERKGKLLWFHADLPGRETRN